MINDKIVDSINSGDVTIDIHLKNGSVFRDKDLTSSPFGQGERVVSFVEGNSIHVFPLTEVEMVVIKGE